MPDGWEAVVSSAYPMVPGLRRKEFLRELVSLRRVDRRRGHARQGNDGRDDRLRPARDRRAIRLADRRARAAARLERGLRCRATSSSRATSPTAPSSSCRPRSRSSRTSSSTITRSSRRSASSRRSSSGGLRAFRRSCATLRRTTASSALPGEHNRRERGRGARRARARRRDARRGRSRARPLHGHGPAVRGARAASVTIVDDYAHHPTEIAATIAAARERWPGAAAPRPLPAASLFTHAAPGRRARGGPRRRRRRHGDRHLSRARAADRRRHGQARRRRAERPGRARRRTRRRWSRASSAWRAARGRATCCSWLGAGDVDRAVGLLRAIS